jgi:hypothetical protein
MKFFVFSTDPAVENKNNKKDKVFLLFKLV